MTEPRIVSEAIEPTAAYLVGRWFAACEAVKDDRLALEGACIRFWWGLSGLERIAIASPGATHFSIAVMNEHRRVRAYIMDRLGVDPNDDPAFKTN